MCLQTQGGSARLCGKQDFLLVTVVQIDSFIPQGMVKPRAAVQDGTRMHNYSAMGQIPDHSQPQPQGCRHCSFHPFYLNTSRE